MLGFFNQWIQFSSHTVVHTLVLSNPNQHFPIVQQPKSKPKSYSSTDGWQMGCAVLSGSSLICLPGHPWLETHPEPHKLHEGTHCKDCWGQQTGKIMQIKCQLRKPLTRALPCSAVASESATAESSLQDLHSQHTTQDRSNLQLGTNQIN